VALFVTGVRLLLVAAWAGDTPYLDEWVISGWLHIHAAEAPTGIPWAWLAFPDVEHRLVGQKLFSLVLAWLNGGQWDVWVELCASTALWGTLSGGLVALGGQFIRGRALAVWAILVGAGEAIPHAWENLLWAFQVQFVLVIGGSLLAIWLLLRFRPLGAPWWLGLFAAVFAWSTQAGGALVLPVVFLNSIDRLTRTPSNRDARMWIAAVLLVVTAALCFYFNPSAPEHRWIHASSLSTWSRSAGSLLAWPWSRYPWLAVAIWMPGLVFLMRAARPRTEIIRDRVFGFLLAWAFAMLLASAWARGEVLVRDLPATRYADLLIIGVLLNALALVHWAAAPVRSRIRLVCAAAWLALVLVGLSSYTTELAGRASRATSITALSRREFVASRAPHAAAIRAYLHTRDPVALEQSPPIFPVAAHLGELIDRLRAAHRWPARLSESESTSWPWLSRAANHAQVWGWGCVAAALIAATLAILRTLPVRPGHKTKP